MLRPRVAAALFQRIDGQVCVGSHHVQAHGIRDRDGFAEQISQPFEVAWITDERGGGIEIAGDLIERFGRTWCVAPIRSARVDRRCSFPSQLRDASQRLGPSRHAPLLQWRTGMSLGYVSNPKAIWCELDVLTLHVSTSNSRVDLS